MRRTTAERLPSLAHPIFFNPGDAKNEKGLFLPPYPDIDLKNWAGFFFSHIVLMGFNKTYPEQRQVKDWQFYRDLTHEVSHKYQAFSRFSRFLNCHMFMFWIQILGTFEEGKQQIPVPLCHNLSRNELEEQWEVIVALQRASELVEEVYAVQSSLSALRKKRLRTNDFRKRLATDYMNEYEKGIRLFPKAYKAFDRMVKKIGETAANGMITSVLDALNPNTAFRDIMLELQKIDSYSYISNLPFEQALDYFRKIFDRLDPDDSKYGRAWLLKRLESLENYSVIPQKIKDSRHAHFAQFLLDPQENIICCDYFTEKRDFIYVIFYDSDKHIKPVDYGNFALIVESIRQQLTQGRGLLCPFWLYARDRCCGNRELFEKIWKCTANSSCKKWKRLGCLNQ
jgi:tetratricopeptide (TPR) repeat protein